MFSQTALWSKRRPSPAALLWAGRTKSRSEHRVRVCEERRRSDRECERTPGGGEMEGHVAVGLGKFFDIHRLHHSHKGVRRHDRVEAIALKDRGALENLPGALPAFQSVDEACVRGHVHEHAVNLSPHQNADRGLGDGAVARESNDRRRDQMLRRPSAFAALDEFRERAAKPRDRDLALGMEGRKQFPASGLGRGIAPRPGSARRRKVCRRGPFEMPVRDI
jgi:hypothetical protein